MQILAVEHLQVKERVVLRQQSRKCSMTVEVVMGDDDREK